MGRLESQSSPYSSDLMGDNTFPLIIPSRSGSILKSVTSPLGPLLCSCIRTIWGFICSTVFVGHMLHGRRLLGPRRSSLHKHHES